MNPSKQGDVMTDESFYELLDDLEAVPYLARSAEIKAFTDEERTDLAGAMNSLASALGAHKRGLIAELPSNHEGQRWAYRQGRKAKRSYNTQGLLVKIAAKIGGTLVTTLVELMAAKVIDITWNYSAPMITRACRKKPAVTKNS